MQRIIIIVMAILISVPVVIKSRVRGIKPAPAAFSVVSSGARLIRISGDVSRPGLYSIGANMLTSSAIKMAMLGRSFKALVPAGSELRPVMPGQHLQLALRKDGCGIVTVGSLPSVERMILGVALDINAMSAADFDLLPGIGPIVAQRIILYRHNNGGKMSVKELQEVEGIGEKRYKVIKVFF